MHRMSMMAHRVRVLPFNTFRLNLSVCSPYNADFDGDEMNMHVPQSVEAMTELRQLAGVSKQMISPKNGMPVMGVVQDTLLGIYLISVRDNYFNRVEMLQLLNGVDCFHPDIGVELPMPYILKPVPTWSGKQLISMLLPKAISFAKLPTSESKQNKDDRSGLMVRNGELLTGCLVREHVGPGSGKIIHMLWVEMGPASTKKFIVNVQRLV